VFVAACYGPQMVYATRGTVLDKVTRAGVSGVKVTCADAPGEVAATTGEQGQFVLAGRCSKLSFEVDAYQPLTTEVGDGATVELEPEVP
jgi:hypothetical protein